MTWKIYQQQSRSVHRTYIYLEAIFEVWRKNDLDNEPLTGPWRPRGASSGSFRYPHVGDRGFGTAATAAAAAAIRAEWTKPGVGDEHAYEQSDAGDYRVALICNRHEEETIRLMLQNTPSGPPTDTAMSLDQMFGHSGFSSAISLAQATPPNQLNTPFYEILLQNLLQQQQHQNHSQPDLAPAHIQQTRSGRISRPPVPYQMAQTELMRALQMLSQPGMEPVRAAMESAGLFQGMGQAQGDMGEAEKRDQAISQAMQLYAAAQNRAGESTQGYTGATGVASTNGYAHSATRNQNGSDSLPKGTKRPRKSEPTSSSRPPNTRHTQPAPYSPDNWPAPPRGKGSRLAMSKEEIASRRKERNKASALASRMKRANEVEDVKDALARKEAEAEELARKCECLERE